MAYMHEMKCLYIESNAVICSFRVMIAHKTRVIYRAKLRVCLVQFQIHCELETFQFILRNDSRSNQNHFVKSFVSFIEMF
jgi:hypothetical protein